SGPRNRARPSGRRGWRAGHSKVPAPSDIAWGPMATPITQLGRPDAADAPAHLGPRAPVDARGLFRAFLDHVQYSRGKDGETATTYDRFEALALTVRDRLAERWVRTQRGYYEADVKRAYYLSAEYLLGRALGNNLIATGLMGAAIEAFRE